MSIDFRKLIESILKGTSQEEIIIDSAVENQNDNDGKVYSDQTILRRAKDIQSPPPYKYKEMSKIEPIINNAYFSRSDYITSKFYLQGKFMEDFTDEYDYEMKSTLYLPTYTDFKLNELRGYFTWRTKVRQGIINSTNLSYFYLYVYEIINLIGCSDVKDGFERLINIWKVYRELDDTIDAYLKRFVKDFIIFYDLDTTYLLECPVIDLTFTFNLEKYYKALENKDLDKIVHCLNDFSSYKVAKSKFYKDYSNDYNQVIYNILIRLTDWQNKNRKNSLFSRMFGDNKKNIWRPFPNAVFYINEKKIDRKYELNIFELYTCENGIWYESRYSDLNIDKAYIGSLLKATDYFLRCAFSYSNMIALPSISKLMQDMIKKEVDEYCKKNDKISYCINNKKKKDVNKPAQVVTPKEIIIDTKKFDDIRSIAKITQQKLIIEEEIENTEIGNTEQIAQKQDDKNILSNLTPIEMFLHSLHDYERKIIVLLLNNKSEEIKDIIKAQNVMTSVVFEGINEKALEYFGDNIIDTVDAPYIYDDYMEDILVYLS